MLLLHSILFKNFWLGLPSLSEMTFKICICFAVQPFLLIIHVVTIVVNVNINHIILYRHPVALIFHSLSHFRPYMQTNLLFHT
jgi:hypothetical protein